MLRKIIQIDEDKCNGCGLCAKACHENAIGLVNGKAKLLREDYCDGLGDCLPNCPVGAISFVEKEAAAYDEAAVKANREKLNGTLHTGCPGSMVRMMAERTEAKEEVKTSSASQLRSWPVQIKLAPINAPYFKNAKLLIAADCTAYAYANFHQDFIRGKVVLIGCPKLDNTDYSDKLSQIIKENDIESVTIVRMEVPCCGGLEMAAKRALQASGKFLPWQVITIGVDGSVVE